MSGSPDTPHIGYMVGAFDGPDALIRAVRFLHARGVVGMDAHTPYPVEGLNPWLEVRRWPLPVLAAICAVGGFCISVLIQVVSHTDYPLNVGGRPILTWTAFVLPGLQFAALSAVLGTALGLFLANGFPRLAHPLFGDPGFDRVSDDAFLVTIPLGPGGPSDRRAADLLHEAGAVAVRRVGGEDGA